MQTTLVTFHQSEKSINQFIGTITEIKGAIPNAKIQDLVPCSETTYDPAGIFPGYYEISTYPSNNLDIGSGGGSIPIPIWGETTSGGGATDVSGG